MYAMIMTFSEASVVCWKRMLPATLADTTEPMAKARMLNRISTSAKKPSPPARSGCVATVFKSSRAILRSSRVQMNNRHTHR